jgi:hypothetical protein
VAMPFAMEVVHTYNVERGWSGANEHTLKIVLQYSSDSVYGFMVMLQPRSIH